MLGGIFVSHGRSVGDLVGVDIRQHLSSSEPFFLPVLVLSFSLVVVALFPVVLSVLFSVAVLLQDFPTGAHPVFSRVWLSFDLFLLSCGQLVCLLFS